MIIPPSGNQATKQPSHRRRRAHTTHAAQTPTRSAGTIVISPPPAPSPSRTGTRSLAAHASVAGERLHHAALQRPLNRHRPELIHHPVGLLQRRHDLDALVALAHGVGILLKHLGE